MQNITSTQAPQPAAVTPCRVWIVEDHVSVRQLLESFVAAIPGITLVGSSENEEQAMIAARNGEIDVVILDLMIPGVGGISALAKFSELKPAPRVIIYSAAATVQSLQLAMSYGAYGYIEKTDSIEELKKAIVRVQASGVHFSPGPGRLLTTLIRSGPVASGVEARNELRLLELFARGFSIKAAAFEMGITNQKAYRIRQSLMQRAQARNVQDLTRYAIEIGLLGAGRLGPVPKV